MSTQDIVQKLWNLCNVLRDDGITYHQYVTELTYILFLKMLEETGEESALQKEIDQAYKKRLEKYAASKKKLSMILMMMRKTIERMFSIHIHGLI